MASIGGLEEYLISSFPLPPANVQQHPRDQAPKLTSLSYPQAKSRQLDNERVMITTPSSGLSVYDVSRAINNPAPRLDQLFSKHRITKEKCTESDYSRGYGTLLLYRTVLSRCSHLRLSGTRCRANLSLSAAQRSNCAGCHHARSVIPTDYTGSREIIAFGIRGFYKGEARAQDLGRRSSAAPGSRHVSGRIGRCKQGSGLAMDRTRT